MRPIVAVLVVVIHLVGSFRLDRDAALPRATAAEPEDREVAEARHVDVKNEPHNL